HTRFSRDWSSDVCSSDLIADAAGFYWLVSATPGFDEAQRYDLELTATGFDAFDPSSFDDLRIVRRADGDSLRHAWSLHGLPDRYANQLAATPQPNTPVVRVSRAVGPLTPEGTRFSIGVAPAFVDYSRLQVVHNAPDVSLPRVDLYLNDSLWVDDLAFQSATPFRRLAPGRYRLTVAPGASTDATDGFFTETLDLAAGSDYLAVAAGLLAPAASPANPEGLATAFDVVVSGQARAVAPPGAAGQVALTFFNGVP